MSGAISVEFADRASGIRGWIGAGVPGLGSDGAAALVFDGDKALISHPSGATVSVDRGRASAKLSSGEVHVEVEVNADAEVGPLSFGPAKVELGVNGRRRSLVCPGGFGELVDGAGPEGELLRTIVALRVDGSALALRSVRPAGEAEHGGERSEAWLLEPETQEKLSVFEPLLSTQYDAQGRQARAGLELWVGADDEAPVRCAGTRRSGVELELDGWRLKAAFFDWAIDGVDGAGSYMIWRRSS